LSAPIRLCSLEDLPPGAARGFDPHDEGEDTIFVLRSSAGVVRAFHNLCPHANARLEYRKDKFLTADGLHVMCHAHGAVFDPSTGACFAGAALGQSLRAISCWIEQGGVWVAFDPLVR
jgi:nitrite reductase/ring-hydroxylating ferredoxin subunit